MRSAIGEACSVAAIIAGVAGCYPDFQFTSSTGGAHGTTTGSRSGSASTTSKSATQAVASTANVATTGAATTSTTSTGMALPGPPCMPTDGSQCSLGEACCFNKTKSMDACHTWNGSSFSCGSGYVTLACNTDATCSNGKCCVIIDASFSITGTQCRADCSASDAFPACNPKAPSCPNLTSCTAFLDQYYASGTAPAPYDQYGQCI